MIVSNGPILPQVRKDVVPAGFAPVSQAFGPFALQLGLAEHGEPIMMT
jgi:hypothetical protein